MVLKIIEFIVDNKPLLIPLIGNLIPNIIQNIIHNKFIGK